MSLVGTRADMVDLREVVKNLLAEKGYSVRAFDEADYPYEPGKDPGECTTELAGHSDVLLLILDRRYGERLPSNGLSITENEWRNACRSEIPLIVACVRSKAIAELEQWRAVGGTWSPRYVDDVDLLRFIERVRDTTFLLEFDNAEDLRVSLDKKMKSLTPYILRKVSFAACENARNRRTVTVIDQTLSLGDVFDRGLYVTPPYRLASGTSAGHSLEEDVSTCLQSRHNMIITGGPGTGKSTALVQSLCRRVAHVRANPLLTPVYVDCYSLGPSDFASVESLLGKLFELALGKNIWPHFDRHDPVLQVELFFDALDEVRDGAVLLEQMVAESPVWSWCSHLVTCRWDFLSRVLVNPGTAARYQYIAELLPWDLPHIRAYVERKFANDKPKTDEMTAIIETSETFKGLAQNVIGLVMLCSLDDVSMIDDAGTLYRAFLAKWAARESYRVDSPGVDADMIISVWQRIAWQLLVAARDGGVAVSSLPHMFDKYDGRCEAVLSPVVRSLLVTTSIGRELVVSRFVHDSIYEYLLAAELVEQLEGSSQGQMQALEQDTWYEVNEFAQVLMLQWDETDCARVVDNLVEVYAIRRSDDSSKGLLVRNKACYYVGRLGRQASLASSKAFDFLDRVWQEEETAFVRQSIGYARSIAGLPNAATDFVNEMRANEELDSLNRGYHLAYYGDIKGQDPPYSDPRKGSWQQTHRALVHRVSHDSEPKRNSRAVDLYTMRRFFETRGQRPTSEEIGAATAILRNLGSYREDLRPTIESECSEMMRVVG